MNESPINVSEETWLQLLKAAEDMDALMENLWKAVPWGRTFGIDIAALNTVPPRLKAAIDRARKEMEE